MDRCATQNSVEIRHYAGKIDLGEVFVTDYRPLDQLTHHVTALWPRHHVFYTPVPGQYTLMLLTESVRQSLAVASHLGLDVPIGHRMGWDQLSCSVEPDTLAAAGSDPGQPVELTITHDPFEKRRSGLARLTSHVRAAWCGRTLGTAHVRYTAYPPALYDRLRGEHADAREAFARALPPGQPVDPVFVGRTDPHDVVLAEDTTHPGTGSREHWGLRADTGHTVLFDHPHDHIPGMILLEAASQAVQAGAAPVRVVPVGFDATFSRYVELDEPCAIDLEAATLDTTGRLEQVVTGSQCGTIAFTARVTGVIEERCGSPAGSLALSG
jgi:hypothetical protein